MKFAKLTGKYGKEIAVNPAAIAVVREDKYVSNCQTEIVFWMISDGKTVTVNVSESVEETMKRLNEAGNK